jgi:excisionase family DNA binding protein
MTEIRSAAGEEPVPLWTVDQVCHALACRRSWLYDQVEARRIPVVRLGRQLRFRPADITHYLDTHTEPATTSSSPARRQTARIPRRRRRITGRGQPTDLIDPPT